MRTKLTLLTTTTLAAVAAALSLTTAASAHVPATCTIAGEDAAVLLHYNGNGNSYAPLHIVGTTSVLAPLKVAVNGNVVADISAGVAGSAVPLTTCTFTSSLGTLEVSGILTPARP